MTPYQTKTLSIARLDLRSPSMQACDPHWVAGVARIPWPLSRMPQNSKAISQSSRPSAWTPRPPRGTACCRRVARHVIWDFGGHSGRAHAPALHCWGVQPVDEVSARVSQVGLLPKTRCNCRNHRFRLCFCRKVLRHPAAGREAPQPLPLDFHFWTSARASLGLLLAMV